MKKFWWVNHNQTFRQEIDGGYLWSPKKEKGGKNSQFYNNMRIASANDFVLSFAAGKISYIGLVSDYAFTCPQPGEFRDKGEAWAKEGWMLPVSWKAIPSPVAPKDHLDAISGKLPQKYSPFNLTTGTGNQKAYLAEISQTVFDEIVKLGNADPDIMFKNTEFPLFENYIDRIEDSEEKLLRGEDERITEKPQLVNARRGQGKFKENVWKVEKGCRITGISNPNFLIASHIKPWRSSDSKERLDGNNGLLLTPNADRLFDRGYISFENDGELLVSGHLADDDLNSLLFSPPPGNNLGPFCAEQCKYLEFHRNNVFLSRETL